MPQRQQYPSAVRNATFVGDEINLFEDLGVKAVLDVTTVPGTDTVQLVIEENVGSEVGGVRVDRWVQIPGAATAARSAVGTDVLTVYPGIAAIANQAVNYAPASRVRARVVHSGPGNFGYYVRLETLD